MDEKDMINGLPPADNAVSDVPPEPDPPKEYPYGGPSGNGQDPVQVSLQKEQSEEQPERAVTEDTGNIYHYGGEDQQGVHPAGQSQEGASYGDTSWQSYGNGQGTPPPDHGYGGRQETPPPPPGYGYGAGSGQGYGSQGYQQQGYAPYRAPKKNNNMALASLILGIMSIVLCCCGGFGIILGAVGIVLAILSRGREPMETSAKVGCGLSIGGIVLGIAVLIVAFAVVGSDEFRTDLYRKGYGDYGDYSHYFEHGGM